MKEIYDSLKKIGWTYDLINAFIEEEKDIDLLTSKSVSVDVIPNIEIEIETVTTLSSSKTYFVL
jgi:hypothetical protein